MSYQRKTPSLHYKWKIKQDETIQRREVSDYVYLDYALILFWFCILTQNLNFLINPNSWVESTKKCFEKNYEKGTDIGFVVVLLWSI